LDTRQEFRYAIVGSYFNYAVVEKDRINLTFPNGRLDILDRNNRPIPDVSVRSEIMLEALKDMRRFYAK
jgi:membrane-anchored protein YejM (alkaline phosphatase superfamily)